LGSKFHSFLETTPATSMITHGISSPLEAVAGSAANLKREREEGAPSHEGHPAAKKQSGTDEIGDSPKDTRTPLCSPAAPRPFTVVLTGGPCAGKSSVMAVLKRRLSVRGFQVLTVPENATHLLANSDGFQPEWAGKQAQIEMQRIFLDFQLDQERAFHEFARLNQKPAVLLLDRSVMDCKVFVEDAQWEKVLNHPTKPQLLEDELLRRYDLVIHMVTVADAPDGGESKYEWGPNSNNPGRYHSPAQAREQDARCLQVYKPHPQLRVVPSFDKFDEKVDAVLTFLNDALAIDGLAGKRTRTGVRLLAPLRLDGCTAAPIPKSVLELAQAYMCSYTYLDADMQHCVRRMTKVSVEAWQDRFAKVLVSSADALGVAPESPCLPDFEEVMYEKRHKVKPADGEGYLVRKIITEDEYLTAVDTASCTTLHKYVLSFMQGRHYYELLFFTLQDGRVVLDLAEGAPVPGWVEAITEQNPDFGEASDPTGGDVVRADSAASQGISCVPASRTNLENEDPCTNATMQAKLKNAQARPAVPQRTPSRALLRHTTEEAAYNLMKRRSISQENFMA